jgi:hypothetical protein
MTNGATEPLPDYYVQIKAAKFLGVPVWELIEQPQYWTSAALITMQADHEVEEKRREKQEREAKRKRGKQ